MGKERAAVEMRIRVSEARRVAGGGGYLVKVYGRFEGSLAKSMLKPMIAGPSEPSLVRFIDTPVSRFRYPAMFRGCVVFIPGVQFCVVSGVLDVGRSTSPPRVGLIHFRRSACSSSLHRGKTEQNVFPNIV